MKTWAQVADSPEYKALPTDEQEKARAQYFKDVVAPRVPPEKLMGVRQQFDRDTRETPVSSALGQAVKSLPGSALRFGRDVYESVRHPVETVKNLADVAIGEMRKAAPSGQPDPFKEKNPEAAARTEKTADAVNAFYRERYGSAEGFKRALATDPVGVASDISALAGVGEATIPGRVGEIAGAISRATNPAAAAKAAGVAAKGAGWLGKKYVGMRTGVGSEAVSEAVQAGRTGDKAFTENMRGQAGLTDVLKDADANLQAMMKQKNAEYKTRMAGVQGNKTIDPWSIHNIRTAVQVQKNAISFAGLKTNKRASQALSEVNRLVERWRNWRNPDALTPMGLDALKRRIGGVLESLPYEQKTARHVVQQVYDATRKEIIRVAPDYAETMEKYSEASEQIRDIQQALLGKGSNFSKDTALRRLQSVMRNNVQTNYGERLALAKALEKAGGRPLLPALAGQAMSSWEPRGINRLLASGELAGAWFHPSLLADVAAQSPRLVGEAAYAAGRASPAVEKLYRSAISNPAMLRTLLSGKAGELYGLPEPDETGAVR